MSLAVSAREVVTLRVSCFCGQTFFASEDIGVCPKCGVEATVPSVSSVEQRQMEEELQRILNLDLQDD